MIRDQVRKTAEHNILLLYRDCLKNLTPLYPLNPKIAFAAALPEQARLISYARLAEISHVEVRDIAAAFGSGDGCTHYNRTNGRYLVAYSTSAPKSRIRWTLAHELGHILCGHFLEIEQTGGKVRDAMWFTMEDEANAFAACVLAPIPAIRRLRPRSASDIQRWFGLSGTAANTRWSEYRGFSGEHFLDECFSRMRVTVNPAVRGRAW